MPKINCPFHQDDTASLEVYPDGYHCFGCGAHGTIDELQKRDAKIQIFRRARKLPPEDIKASVARIRNLPKKEVRGFFFPSDELGYYIIYPGCQYYVKRLYKPLKPSDKYRSPSGHKKPLYKALYGSYEDNKLGTLMVVEGQLNALTAAMVLGFDGPLRVVVSPGGASDLNRPDFVEYYLQYDDICIIVDKDAAGVVSGITLRDALLAKGKQVSLHAVETDFNDTYVRDGQEALQGTLSEILSMQRGLPQRQESLPTSGEGTSQGV